MDRFFKTDFSVAGLFRLLVTAIAVSMALYHMWMIAFGAPEAVLFRGTHLLFAMVLLFLIYRSGGEPEGLPGPLDLLLLAGGAVPILYLFYNYDYIINRIFYVDDLTFADMAMGTILIAVILEGTRRIIGLALPLTALVFLAYGLFVARLDPMQILDQLYMTTEGIFGIPLSVSATYVLIFVLFGAFMERTGTGQLFMNFAMALTGHTAGGPGKVAIVSSSLFGTISGSAVANVMVTGPISIPLMKRTGFRPPFAAGVEAVASTGGQLMPPIMGAAAFVMAEFLAVSYGQVIIWALIPAVLFYISCFTTVHLEARRRGLTGVPRSELPRLSLVMRDYGHLFAPAFIILFVMYSGYSAPLAALAGTLSCFPIALLRKTTRHHFTISNILGALVDGTRGTLPVALACACAGIIIGIVTLSGLGITFSQFVLGLAQDTLILALVLTMFAGIVLGMGIPTTPAYIIMTALLVPALIKLGVAVPAAHMFAFYFAILSAITPPVALAVYAAAGLAKSDLWSSGWAAVKIGATGFIIPFMFVYEPALLMIGDWVTIVSVCITASAGVIFFAAGLQGFFLAPTALWQRLALIGAGLALIKPGLVTDIVGGSLFVAVFATQYLARRTARSAAVGDTGAG